MDLETRKKEAPYVTTDDIKAGINDIGLKKGDLVVVHSSLSAFGYVQGGADTVIDALIDTLGQGGTLIMPSFTGLPVDDHAAYDRQTTPARVGIISDAFWKRRDVIRSRHPPRKPWAGWGRLAPDLITLSERRLHDAHHYLGILDAVADLNGYVLLLGCPNSSNTSIHTAQVAAFNHVEGARKCIVEFLAVDATNHTPGDGPTFFTQLDAPLIQAGAMRMGRIGDAEIRFMRSREMFDVVKSIYKTKYQNMDLPMFKDYNPDPRFPIEKEYKNMIEQLTARQQVRSE